ncbi:MAG TPA: class I SAM-dependent methyltransferase [Methylomirabilota bacterium]|nr:class I SAM-dependent methyltransferase [Methylomirabilota bacterium]
MALLPTNAPPQADAVAAQLRDLLPPYLLPVIDVSFLRSHYLYDEFVYRLVLQVIRATGLESAIQAGGSTETIATRENLAPQAVVPLDWMLRLLAARRVLEERPGAPAPEFRPRGPLPTADPAAVRAEQNRHDPSWEPSYVLAETVAQDYPAFLRGAVAGEEVLFAPRRLRLWVDFFSNRNGLYAVNNRTGAAAVEQWLPRDPGVVLELGGGLGSGALAVLEQLGAAGRLGTITEYRFTELVPAFLRRGEQALRARRPDGVPVRFGALDMNLPFDAQGIAPGSVAAVYAVNTLHVAHDLDFTLAQILRALRPGGWLIISECVRSYPRQAIYAEFVFNLIETFRSPRLHLVYRPNGGFLTPEQWRGAMEAAGLADVRFVPDVVRIHRQVPDFFVSAIGATRPA